MVLFYVDDILIWSQLKGEAKRIFDMLAKKYKLKRTGFIEEGCEGEVTFLGRKIFRTKEMAGKNAVMFGLEPAYLWSCRQLQEEALHSTLVAPRENHTVGGGHGCRFSCGGTTSLARPQNCLGCGSDLSKAGIPKLQFPTRKRKSSRIS